MAYWPNSFASRLNDLRECIHLWVQMFQYGLFIKRVYFRHEDWQILFMHFVKSYFTPPKDIAKAIITSYVMFQYYIWCHSTNCVLCILLDLLTYFSTASIRLPSSVVVVCCDKFWWSSIAVCRWGFKMSASLIAAAVRIKLNDRLISEASIED